MAKYRTDSNAKARKPSHKPMGHRSQKIKAVVLREDSAPYYANGNARAGKLKVLDTFAGAGGFSLGFELAGCEIVGGIEIDSWASETFAFNHKDAVAVQRDLQTVSDDELCDMFANRWPDILLGGPPCQGFSICRKNAGDPTDPRNSLFVEFLRAAKVFQPDFVIMENVPNIENARTHNGESVLGIIKRELQRLDYHVSHTVLEATDFGVPQIRRRLFVVASARELELPFPKPTHSVESGERDLFGGVLKRCPALWEAISDLPELQAGESSETQNYLEAPQNDYQRQSRDGSDKLWNHTAMRHSKRMVERFAAMTCGQSVSDVPKHLRPLKRNGNGAISGKVYDQNNRRMHPDRPCHTIPASFYANFVHPFQHRNFTPREGARLQSFPDSFVFKGKPTVVSHKLLAREGRTEEKHLCQYNQIGNAVPPLLAQAIAQNLLNQSKTQKAHDYVCSR
ncbi:MAG TPA: DNA cytosine methyltransferase [Verrucomicrobiae bacterium]|nr:DNA cytosine methyltransferase [Verrucomicrobiae bacterium]